MSTGGGLSPEFQAVPRSSPADSCPLQPEVCSFPASPGPLLTALGYSTAPCRFPCNLDPPILSKTMQNSFLETEERDGVRKEVRRANIIEAIPQSLVTGTLRHLLRRARDRHAEGRSSFVHDRRHLKLFFIPVVSDDSMRVLYNIHQPNEQCGYPHLR